MCKGTVLGVGMWSEQNPPHHGIFIQPNINEALGQSDSFPIFKDSEDLSPMYVSGEEKKKYEDTLAKWEKHLRKRKTRDLRKKYLVNPRIQ